ncbi:anthranilate synthase component I family protein [Congregibacter sp.]|uniref:anthranilate synthase component I family protein n=1 Tax=Congregibacter sp. TaxID=2744308 RepID=UPI003F6C53D8
MPVEKLDDIKHSVSLPYFSNACDIYERIRCLGSAVLLDSADGTARGRFDILAAQPDVARSLTIDSSCSGPALDDALQRWQTLAEQQTTELPNPHDLPFHGGYIGHFSYELGRRLHNLAPSSDQTLPIASVYYYPWAIVQDRQKERSWLVGEPQALKAAVKRLNSLLLDDNSEPATQSFKLEQAFEHSWSLNEYRQHFDTVKRYVGQGDCYQINIGQPFSAPYSGDLFDAYRQLRTIAKAPFSAFFPLTKEHSLLCLSPERFLTVEDAQIETRPIKGTRPRHRNTADDQAAAAELLASEKERAENLMITDLLRNDIGRYCTPGTVHAQELFTLESYSTVHHLVSVVTGLLSPRHSTLDLLLGCMPGGSITGAPKHRAMQIIDELEPAPRQSWCGSLFYLSRHGRLDSNIAIRTLFNEGQRLHCWAGGGLVDDSEAEAEYQEQQDKVGAFLKTLEKTL